MRVIWHGLTNEFAPGPHAIALQIWRQAVKRLFYLVRKLGVGSGFEQEWSINVLHVVIRHFDAHFVLAVDHVAGVFFGGSVNQHHSTDITWMASLVGAYVQAADGLARQNVGRRD